MEIRYLPFPKYPGIKHLKQYELPSDLYIEQWIVPTGTVIKLITTRNFGFVVLPPQCKDRRGFVMPRRLFRY